MGHHGSYGMDPHLDLHLTVEDLVLIASPIFHQNLFL